MLLGESGPRLSSLVLSALHLAFKPGELTISATGERQAVKTPRLVSAVTVDILFLIPICFYYKPCLAHCQNHGSEMAALKLTLSLWTC